MTPRSLLPAVPLLVFALSVSPGPRAGGAQAADASPAPLASPLPVRFGGRSFRFDRPITPPLAGRLESPVSLTASDGTGLKLARMTARAVVEDPLAFTELRLAFENPQDRVIEGRFRIVLPPGAMVSRFAMKQDDRWQEGEVVERQKARLAYEDFLHRRQDPALLEQGAANEFAARVFPIPARGIKELVVSYSQELAGAESRYVIPLAGLPELGELDIAVHSGGALVGRMQKTRFVPARDFEIRPPRPAGRSGLRQGSLAVARVRPLAAAQPDEIPSLLVLFDTSASRALGYDAQLRLLERLLEGLARGAGPKTPLAVAAFDQTIEVVYEGGAGGFGPGALKRLRRRRALGASDLHGALAWAHGALLKRPARRVLLVTDGVATAGPAEASELAARAQRLKSAGAERLDAVAVGGIRDESGLRGLVTSGLARDGVVADGTLDPSEIGRKLTEATRSGLPVLVKGASWTWPRTLDGLQAADEVLVYAELPPSAPFKLSVGGQALAASLAELPGPQLPLLERALARARIESLIRRHDVEADGPEAKAKLREEIVALSVRSRVLSPYTALLVLETEADYDRYGIDRKALTDILAVEEGRLVRMKRGAESLALLPNLPAPGRAVKAKAARARQNRVAGATEESVVLDEAARETIPGADALPPAFDRSADAEAVPGPEGLGSGGGSGGGPMAMLDAAPDTGSSYSMPAAAPEPEPGAAPRALPEVLERPHAARPPSPPAPRPSTAGSGSRSAEPLQPIVPPYIGTFKTVMDLLAAGKATKASAASRAWLEESPGDVLALVALGEALEALGDRAQAARAYGSIIDLYPSRADLRRFAGARLERLKDAGLDLALDTFRKAVEERPDHPSGHRLLAVALLKKGRPAEAFEALAKGLARKYPEGRFLGVDRILREDLGLAAAAWTRAEPGRKDEIANRLREAGGTPEEGPSVRFVLNWETDANDVDFHIYDGKGGHAFYSSPQLPSGGELYADVTTGYGPECFTIRGPKAKRATPYRLQAHYYSRGPMGYGMGKLEIVEHDGQGGLSFEERPFVVMTDGAFVDLGVLRAGR